VTRAHLAIATLVAVVLAQFMTVGPSSHAGGLITGRQVKNESITGRDVTKLTGADLDERSLSTVPRADVAHTATTARTAETVGDLRPEQLLTADGCRPGTALGSVLVLAENGSMPTTYTQSPEYLTSVHNCTGGAVQVRRVVAGQYRVKFLGNAALIGTVQIRPKYATAPSCSVLSRLTAANGVDTDAFRIHTFNCATTANTDVDFSLVLA
jgi:hypothetical protein